MECLHKPISARGMDSPVCYDREKIIRIREKIAAIFGRASTWNDAKISERYNITPDGDLIMIIK